MSVITPAAVQGMVAVSKESGVRPLGYVCWYTLPDRDVPLRQVRAEWELVGLDPSKLPKDVRETDQFKRAVRAEAGRRELDNGTIIETDVRDIPTNDSFITFQVSRVVKDSANVQVDYPKALKALYNRFTGEMTFKALGETSGADAQAMIESITRRFEANQKTITGNRLRAVIQEFIASPPDDGLGGENMRGRAGGVYFVLARHGEKLDALSDFLATIYPDGDGSLYSVPMADGASEREMVRRAHVANSIGEIERAISEGRQLLREDRQRALREDVKQHHFGRLAKLRRHAEEYAAALREEQDDVLTHLDLLSQQLDKLVGE